MSRKNVAEAAAAAALVPGFRISEQQEEEDDGCGELDEGPGHQAEVRLEPKECVICQEELMDAMKLVCGHQFCWVCLNRWLDKLQTDGHLGSCPLCRRPPRTADGILTSSRTRVQPQPDVERLPVVDVADADEAEEDTASLDSDVSDGFSYVSDLSLETYST